MGINIKRHTQDNDIKIISVLFLNDEEMCELS